MCFLNVSVLGTTSWNQTRMTVDELEKLQFIAAEKARQVPSAVSLTVVNIIIVTDNLLL